MNSSKSFSYTTHSALDAPGRFTEQLRFGVLHLRRVEDLLTLYLVQVQEAAETHGSCGTRQGSTFGYIKDA